MFCPKCKTEYRAVIRICLDCGVALVSRLPLPGPNRQESQAEPVALRTYANRFEAEAAANALDSVGIGSTIRNDFREGTLTLPAAGSVQLLVGLEDAAAAEDILKVEGIGEEGSGEQAGGSEKT